MNTLVGILLIIGIVVLIYLTWKAGASNGD